MVKVMRLKIGDIIHIFNEYQGEYIAFVWDSLPYIAHASDAKKPQSRTSEHVSFKVAAKYADKSERTRKVNIVFLIRP